MTTEITTTETVSTETPATPAITRAAERFLEQYGDPLVMNTYLKVTILVLTAVCLALAALTYKSQNALANMHPMIVRINDVGHAEAIDYRNFQYRPQEAENKYYLIDGEARLASLRASHAVPTPTAVLSTSLGKYQILWRVDGFTFDQQESTLKLLVIGFGGDPACTDRNRVLRLPGFLNCKYDPPYPVTVQYPSDFTWNPGDFRLDTTAANPMLLSNAMPPRQHPDKHSNSERDWAWILHELAHGKDPAKLTRSLASRRADKPRPLYYAQRTVDVASARLWLIEGVPIDDVVTMLVVRRRFEIPPAPCSARAREIAQTVQRMIARKKTA